MLEAAELPVLDPAEAYALWAPTYGRETAVSLLEDSLVSTLTPPLSMRRLLDVGCGTGRRMLAAGAASATGVEPCREMIAAGSRQGCDRQALEIFEGDARNLPVGTRSFDVVWCRLVLGHIADLAAPYAQFERVIADRGTVIVSDFHPEADARGHRRTFRNGGQVHAIVNHPHSLADHAAAAEHAGLTMIDKCEAGVGPQIRDFYAERGRLADYERDIGLPLVFALRFERP